MPGLIMTTSIPVCRRAKEYQSASASLITWSSAGIPAPGPTIHPSFSFLLEIFLPLQNLHCCVVLVIWLWHPKIWHDNIHQEARWVLWSAVDAFTISHRHIPIRGSTPQRFIALHTIPYTFISDGVSDRFLDFTCLGPSFPSNICFAVTTFLIWLWHTNICGDNTI